MSEDAGFFKKTSEAVASAGASAAGAVSGSLSLGANASHKKTTTTKTRIPAEAGQGQQQAIPSDAPVQQQRLGGAGGQKQLTQAQADRVYEERIEEEYAKREGGA